MINSDTIKELIGLDYQGKNVPITRLNDHNFPEENSLLFIKEKKNLKLIELGNCFLCLKEWSKEIKPNPQKCFFFTSRFDQDFIRLLNFFNPYKVLQKNLLRELNTKMVNDNQLISSDLKFGPFSTIGENSAIGTGCFFHGHNSIGHKVKIGHKVILHPGVVVGNGTVIGDNTIVHANTVIGGDGFGYQSTATRIKKIPQIGNVVIGYDVEIGSNVSIDRATINSTMIGNKVKVDNLVQIAHNVQIKDNTIIVSQTGIAGSSKIGQGVILAGQVGISNHVTIEDGVMVGPQSGVPAGKTISKGSKIIGSPALNRIKKIKLDLFLQKLFEEKFKK